MAQEDFIMYSHCESFKSYITYMISDTLFHLEIFNIKILVFILLPIFLHVVRTQILWYKEFSAVFYYYVNYYLTRKWWFKNNFISNAQSIFMPQNP